MNNPLQAVDLIVIGGGINGMAIAGQAACRGLKVVLIEQNDIASGTSSKSTQLIHGGLRYLQQYDFSLVKKALQERTVLMKMAPHLIKPMEFIIPDYKPTMPHWLKRIGLFVYDHLSGHNPLPKAHTLNLSAAPYSLFLKSDIKQGLVYSDAITHDSRLVMEWALLAKEHQAKILNYQSIIGLTEKETGWQVMLREETYEAPILINATGPWAAHFHQHYLATFAIPKIRLVKGSHLVLKKALPDNKSYLLECADGRIVFLTPYEPGYSLLGTTELEYQGSLEDIKVEQAEIEYLLESANVYLQNALDKKDIVACFAGVRPLVEDGLHNAHQLSRDYHLQLQQSTKGHTLLTVLGGKLTTHRRLALEALILLQKNRPAWPSITDETLLLPGAEP
ncbi:MAG: glycerol-3-phosphate dehydrogenase, partial [Gammaproteobacteria bacterium]|nr:glycerol-3-phosphate dehydrogenase [Gammaproteobacteria bacterium]